MKDHKVVHYNVVLDTWDGIDIEKLTTVVEEFQAIWNHKLINIKLMHDQMYNDYSLTALRPATQEELAQSEAKAKIAAEKRAARSAIGKAAAVKAKETKKQKEIQMAKDLIKKYGSEILHDT